MQVEQVVNEEDGEMMEEEEGALRVTTMYL